MGGAVASGIRKGAKGDPCIYLGTLHSLKTNFLAAHDPQFTCCTPVPGQHKPLRQQTQSPWGSWRVSDLQVQTLLWECRLKSSPRCITRASPWGCRPARQTHPLETPFILQGWWCGTVGDKDRRGWGGQHAPMAPANACGCNGNYRL